MSKHKWHECYPHNGSSDQCEICGETQYRDSKADEECLGSVFLREKRDDLLVKMRRLLSCHQWAKDEKGIYCKYCHKGIDELDKEQTHCYKSYEALFPKQEQEKYEQEVRAKALEEARNMC